MTTVKRCLLILDLKPFRSQVKGKHSIDREFHGLTVKGKKHYAIYQNNEQTSLEKKEVEPLQPIQMNIYQSNTYRKNLSWLHFDDEPRFQERQQVKDKQPCISVFVAYPIIRSSNQEHQPRHDNSISYMAVCYIY